VAGQKPGCTEEAEQMQETDYNFPVVRSRSKTSSAKENIVDSQYILIIGKNAAIFK